MTNVSVKIIRNRVDGLCFVTLEPIPAAAEALDLRTCATVERATRHSIQVGRALHIDGEETRYLNHSCAPTTFVDTVALKVVALRPLRAGESLTFFYPATEWEMATPFNCACRQIGCVGQVAGSKFLPDDSLRRHKLSTHISELLAERDSRKRALRSCPAASGSGRSLAIPS